jgi:hypothetical protein
LPVCFSSTALTALEPMSSPTMAFDLLNPNTSVVALPQSQYQASNHQILGILRP